MRRSVDRPMHPILTRQQSFMRSAPDTSFDSSLLTNSISNSITGSYLYHSESSYFSHFNPRDSFRNSINLSVVKPRPELSRNTNMSFYKLRGESVNNGMLNRLLSTREIRSANESTTQLRKKRDLFFNEMKRREKEVLNRNDKSIPVLLNYLMKKINHLQSKEGEKVLLFTEDGINTKKEESKKDEKEDFLYDIMIKDSQVRTVVWDDR